MAVWVTNWVTTALHDAGKQALDGGGTVWVASVLTATGLVAGLVYFLILHKRKVVSYTYISTPVLVEDKPSGLVITYSGTTVEKPVVNTILVRATGNAEIRKDEFESDIEIRLVGAESVIAPQVQRKVPHGASIEVKQRVATDTIYVPPTLLNPGDGFDLQVVSDGLPSSIEVAARAAGLPIPKRTRLPYSALASPDKADFIASLLVSFLLLFMGYLGIAGLFSSASKDLVIRLMAGGLGVGVTIGGIVLLYRLVTASRLRRIFAARRLMQNVVENFTQLGVS